MLDLCKNCMYLNICYFQINVWKLKRYSTFFYSEEYLNRFRRWYKMDDFKALILSFDSYFSITKIDCGNSRQSLFYWGSCYLINYFGDYLVGKAETSLKWSWGKKMGETISSFLMTNFLDFLFSSFQGGNSRKW